MISSVHELAQAVEANPDSRLMLEKAFHTSLVETLGSFGDEADTLMFRVCFEEGISSSYEEKLERYINLALFMGRLENETDYVRKPF